jgi:hypothetical protein
MTPDLVPCAGKGGAIQVWEWLPATITPGTEESEISIAAGSRSHIKNNNLKQWEKF